MFQLSDPGVPRTLVEDCRLTDAKSGIEHCPWFILPLPLATPTMQFSLNRNAPINVKPARGEAGHRAGF